MTTKPTAFSGIDYATFEREILEKNYQLFNKIVPKVGEVIELKGKMYVVKSVEDWRDLGETHVELEEVKGE